MIERKVVQQKIREYLVESYVSTTLKRVGHSKTKISRSPLGEKITIFASRPGLIVGSKGSNIKKLTKILKAKFKLDNPQIEIEEIRKPDLDPRLIAENIAASLERFGTQRFKGIGYRALENSINSGALGIEILISGKIPSSRAKRWRFYKGYLKKCGDLSIEDVLSAYEIARLKTGVVGIQVRVMPPGVDLPDQMKVKVPVTQVGEVKNDNEVIVDLSSEAEAESKESENLKNIKEKAKKIAGERVSMEDKNSDAEEITKDGFVPNEVVEVQENVEEVKEVDEIEEIENVEEVKEVHEEIIDNKNLEGDDVKNLDKKEVPEEKSENKLETNEINKEKVEKKASKSNEVNDEI